MSETGEMPRGPQPEQEPPRKRLEDMPEFHRMPEYQQKELLAARERIFQEAMNPRDVVTRSIHEMGFWEGMKETVTPHLQKNKEILFKDLKAAASLALSLVPVLGEGKGLGTGLFGVVGAKGAETALKDLKFVPIENMRKAGKFAKNAFNSSRSVNAIVHVEAGAAKAAEEAYKNFPKVGKAKELFYKTKTAARDIFSRVAAPFNAKRAIEISVLTDFSESAREGSKVLAANMARKAGVGEIYHMKKVGESLAKVAHEKALAEGMKRAGLSNKDIRWFNLVDQWKAFGVRRAAKTAAAESANLINVKGVVKHRIAQEVAGKNIVQKGFETGYKNIVSNPKVIDATATGLRSTQFKNFFEKWLNLTPDIPIWLSTTTGFLELFGAHGIDAIPASMQIVANRYQQIGVARDMAVDVFGYTAVRFLGKLAERKRAAEVFATAPVPATG